MKKRRNDSHYLANDNTDDYGQLIFISNHLIITPDLTGGQDAWWKMYASLGQRPERIGTFDQHLQEKLGD
jgi:hypothetical protein